MEKDESGKDVGNGSLLNIVELQHNEPFKILTMAEVASMLRVCQLFHRITTCKVGEAKKL